MRKPWLPRLTIELGDGERHELKALMATEMQEMADLTNGVVTNRYDLVGAVAAEDPATWRALLKVMRKRVGTIQNFAEVDVDLDAAEWWFTDEAGREVEMQLAPQPCRLHRRRGILDDCADCGDIGPNTNDEGSFVWVFTDDGGVVPTRRARRSSSEPASP